MNKFIFLILPILMFSGTQSKAQQKESLKEAFKVKFLMGVVVNRHQINQSNKEETYLITSQFNSLTVEDDMKWVYIHPEENRFNFEQSDKLVIASFSHQKP